MSVARNSPRDRPQLLIAPEKAFNSRGVRRYLQIPGRLGRLRATKCAQRVLFLEDGRKRPATEGRNPPKSGKFAPGQVRRLVSMSQAATMLFLPSCGARATAWKWFDLNYQNLTFTPP